MSPLFQVIPAKARKYVYAFVVFAGIAWAAWQASAGDWKTAVGSLVATAVAALAHANVTPQDSPPNE